MQLNHEGTEARRNSGSYCLRIDAELLNLRFGVSQLLSFPRVLQNMPSACALEYAPGEPVRRRRRVRRVVLYLALLGVLLAGWKWGPLGWRQGRLLYWQRECLNYTRPAGSLLWEEDPVKAGALLKVNADYVCAPTQWGTPWAMHLPKCLQEYERLGGLTPSTYLEPIMLLHELRSPCGNRRLVVVQGTGDLYMAATVYVPAGAWSGPRQVGGGHYAGMIGGFAPPISPMRNGQVDGGDRSRFIVPMLLRGGTTTNLIVEGRLMDDDSVVMTAKVVTVK